MFRAIFLEGFARPLAGIQMILKCWFGASKTWAANCDCGPPSVVLGVVDGRVQKVVLEDGTELEAKNVLSSAGWTETMRLCDDVQEEAEPQLGRLSFVETISVLDKQPQDFGLREDDCFLQ